MARARLYPTEEHIPLTVDDFDTSDLEAQSDEHPPSSPSVTHTAETIDAPPPYTLPPVTHRDPWHVLILIIGVGWTIGLYITYPFPTTIPIFIGLAIILTCWVLLSLTRLGISLSLRRDSISTTLSKYSIPHRIGIVLSTSLLIYWLCLGFTPHDEPLPPLPSTPGKYFIAANLHNNEAVLPRWSDQLVDLAFKLGRNNTFISIYESNSSDRTKSLLESLNHTLTGLSIPHRIITENNDDNWWPYGTSAERIDYLAAARNRALEPLQAEDQLLLDWDQYQKLIFLNDIFFDWEDVIRLVGMEGGDYDLGCGMDFGHSGLYDTWVARDICGTPLRAFWPYVKDKESVEKMRKEEPVEVSACWNGVVVFDSRPFLWRKSEEGGEKLDQRIEKRGWKMIDDPSYPHSLSSPPVTHPIQFRSSKISACDHSECFLVSYDLHRYHRELGRRPKILMNPQVKVAYEEEWWRWNHWLLRIPIVKSWRDYWSHGIPLLFVDWIWELAGRRRDYCTWAGLNLPERCPPLPGPAKKNWDQ